METHANGKIHEDVGKPTNPMVSSLLTDMYQFTMAYAYWKAGKHLDRAVFDLLFRKNPFRGEYTVFAGLGECIKFASDFHFKASDIEFLRSILPVTCEDAFFQYLASLDCSDVEIYAIPEGSVVFPRIPLIRVEGPLLVIQLLETAFLNLVNYASLVTTNAARHRQVAGNDKMLLEFGLRRAQGPDGGISASKYCFMGGFDGTSNVDAAQRFGIPVRGTHAHAFVSAFTGTAEITQRLLQYENGKKTCDDFVALVQRWLSKLKDTESLRGFFAETSESELAAFSSYALSFPTKFQALVDTFDVLKSGIPNFCAVALALNELGYKSLGIRLDSGDLAYLSKEARKFFKIVEKEFNASGFGALVITASNDINEETLDALNKQKEFNALGVGALVITKRNDINEETLDASSKQVILDSGDLEYLFKEAHEFFKIIEKEFNAFGFGNLVITARNDISKQTLDALNRQVHEIDAFGIGTHLVTCSTQSALGCVYKLVEINGQPRMKLSQDIEKVTIPCKKEAYRLYGVEGYALVDIMKKEDEPAPKVGEKILCRHPFIESKRAHVTPQRVEKLYKCYWPGKSGIPREQLSSLQEARTRCRDQINAMRPDHLRGLNPTPYKVSVTGKLYDYIHHLWLSEAPIGELW